MDQRRRGSRGISMVEVLVAFLVLAVAILALLGALPAAARHQQLSTMRAQALYFAQQKMDEILQENTRLSTSQQTDYPFPTMGEGYRTWWGEADPGGNANLQMVTVQVTWLEQQAQKGVTFTHTVQLQSLINP